MKIDVTVRVPVPHEGYSLRGKSDHALPTCRDAEISQGRSGFLHASFFKPGVDRAFETFGALKDLAHAIPEGVVTKIEFVE